MGIKYISNLPSPEEIIAKYPLREDLKEKKKEFDKDIADVFTGKSDKFLAVIGPCSADNEDSVLDYVTRLAKVADEIKDKIRVFLKNAKGDLRIKKFLAGFCNEYGLLCDFKMMHEILEQMDTAEELEIVRNPATNSRGKSRFWDEKNGQTVTIRRLTK